MNKLITADELRDMIYKHRRCTVDQLEAELNAHIDDKVSPLLKLLKMANCPDSSCNNGIIPHQIGEDEFEAQQCQWCFEADAFIAEWEKGQ